MKLLLFSGGLDSTALAHWLRPNVLFFVDYGQISAEGERRAATQIATELGLPLDLRVTNCRSCGAGDMAGSVSLSNEAPEFWPYRNQLLITIAAMAYASATPLTILIGTVRSDQVHPDGRPDFLDKMQGVLSSQGLAQIAAPALAMTSSELLEASDVSSATLAWSFSCHRGNQACGQCRGCQKHFEVMGIGEGTIPRPF